MIEIKGLTKEFNKIKILNNVDLAISKGNRIALLGQNGSGKTTLIRCLLGLYQFEGEINISGKSIKDSRVHALKDIAFVPQLPPALKYTVKEMLEFNSALCDFSKHEVHTIANELGFDLSKSYHTSFKNLSGGMKQKLMIAIALARRPAFLIMDEPSANLDPVARSKFFKLLSDLDPQTTMLLTSHRVDELSGIVNRLVELDQGSVTVDEFIENINVHELAEKKQCHIKLKEISNITKKTLQDWGLKSLGSNELIWEGLISSADSFRFHAVLTRLSSSIEEVSLQKVDHEEL